MHLRKNFWLGFLLIAVVALSPGRAFAQGDAPSGIAKVQHIIVLMQENHSFDNYFGALPYAPHSPYHPAFFGCDPEDHGCVDGLTCLVDASGEPRCFNANLDSNGHLIFAFHDPRRCVVPDLNHSWFPTHQEANFLHPRLTLFDTDSNGFVRVNQATEQMNNLDDTMGFYTQNDIPFYYNLAETFAVNDRYFSSVLGPTFPNRSYFMAATSFGHLTTSDTFPPPGGYKPITGTIFDLLDKNGITWNDYFQDAPQGGSFRLFGTTGVDPHFLPLPVFLAQVAGAPGVPPLPQVAFVDPNFGLTGLAAENDEHPPTDIQRGQAYVSQVINAIRNGPYWQNSVIFITYDEHGGFYDHVPPPPARQGFNRTPDGISPGQCADLSNPPGSEAPGGGAECSANPLSTTDTSVLDAELLCPELTANPTGPYPFNCPSFDQYGFRVPFLAISPFSKRHYVSHTVGDHTSLLAFIEKRFLSTGNGQHQFLTERDKNANTLEDLFDFQTAPSLNTPVGQPAAPPATDCTPVGPAQSTN